MPINADLGGKKYTLGKGKVYFDRYPNGVNIVADTQGEGERYLGNTPEFTTTSSSESLDHFSSEGGLNVKDDSVQLSLDRTGSLVTDNIDEQNVALIFLGESGALAQTAQTGQISVVSEANRGRFYQLGVTETNPSGVRKVSNVVAKKGAGFTTTITAAGNYQVDEDLGRVYIEDDAADIDGVEVQFTFDVAASTRTRIISGSNPIYGALRFVADNPKGENLDYYFPYVKLSPDGDYALKGEEWMQIGFTFEMLKKSDNIEAAYVDGRATVV